jgi:hypothetical protein
MVKPHAKTATALTPRTIENGIMRGAGRAALERTPSSANLTRRILHTNVCSMSKNKNFHNGFIFVVF